MLKTTIAILITLLFFTSYNVLSQGKKPIIASIIDPQKAELKLYWKNTDSHNFGSFGQLNKCLQAQHKTLLFATNGGMFRSGRIPLGLFIQNGKIISKLNVSKGSGNFYFYKNGIFLINEKKELIICETEKYKYTKHIEFATQSGPMLLIEGMIPPVFKNNSKNLCIRSGVGILPDNKAIFAISSEKINFYEFAKYFQSKGCQSALYLDGIISKMYFPERGLRDTAGKFGVIIAVAK